MDIEIEDHALLLLVSLPSFYKNFKETIVVRRKAIDLENVKTTLLNKLKLDTKLTFEGNNDDGAA